MQSNLDRGSLNDVATAIVLYGPKAAGKTQIARLLERAMGYRYVDCDVLVADLAARGIEPDPVDGWLFHVTSAIYAALRQSDFVSVEATGAWDSDWTMATELKETGQRVLRIWVSTTWLQTLQRLRERDHGRVSITEFEAEAIYQRATARASREDFDLMIDTSQPLDEERIIEAVRGALNNRFT